MDTIETLTLRLAQRNRHYAIKVEGPNVTVIDGGTRGRRPRLFDTHYHFEAGVLVKKEQRWAPSFRR